METVCPGCGVKLVRAEGPARPEPLNASAECWRLSCDVFGFELEHPWLVGRCHQMTVDAYGAQHAGPPTKPIRVAYSLVGLHLALELGLSGNEVRDAHQRMGKPRETWPAFPRPKGFALLTIEDVAEAGVRADSQQGHADTVRFWAEAVWAWWAPSQEDARQLARMLLGTWLDAR